MNKRMIVAVMAMLVSAAVAVLLVMQSSTEPETSIGLPYCNSPDVALHTGIANDYLDDNYPDLELDEDSHQEAGYCNNGNTGSSSFLVYKDGEPEGTLFVDGDTNQVEFISDSE